MLNKKLKGGKKEMKQKLLKIEQIKINKETYPRINIDWVTCARYYNALRSGAQFPPITVAKIGKAYNLVDGAHRLNAFKGNKETHIQVEVLEGLDEKQIYLEAVKRNIGHGRQFSTQEVTNICITLEKWDMSQEAISEIKRMTRVTDTKEEFALKVPLQNLAGGEVEAELDQSNLSGQSQVNLLSTLITLLKNGWIDENNELVMKQLKEVYELLEPYQK
jgi:hypothetical protein